MLTNNRCCSVSESIGFSTATSPDSFATTATTQASLLQDSPTASNEVFDPYGDLDLHVDENFGFLRELGLTYGIGPTTLAQSLLEHVYIYTGLPWWAAMLTAVVLVRVAFFKMMIQANETGARLQYIQPQLTEVTQKVMAAKRKDDKATIAKAMHEKDILFREHDIKMSRMFLPLTQAIIGYGSFRLLRDMSTLPVPGLEQGGMLWFKDLTIPDPFFILPLAMGVVSFIGVMNLAKNSPTAPLPPSALVVVKWILPFLASFINLFFPASVQLTILAATTWSITQGLLFREPWVRKWLGMTPILQSKPLAPTSSSPYARTGPMVLNVRNSKADSGPSNMDASSESAPKGSSSSSLIRRMRGEVVHRRDKAIKQMRTAMSDSYEQVKKTSMSGGSGWAASAFKAAEEKNKTPRRSDGEIKKIKDYEARRQKDIRRMRKRL